MRVSFGPGLTYTFSVHGIRKSLLDRLHLTSVNSFLAKLECRLGSPVALGILLFKKKLLLTRSWEVRLAPPHPQPEAVLIEASGKRKRRTLVISIFVFAFEL